MASIVTLTANPAIDASLQVDEIEPEIKLRCARPRRDPGGGGLNVSRAILEFGGVSTAVFPAGGLAGDRLDTLLGESGVECRRVPIEAETRENFMVREKNERGRQFRFNTPGAPMSDGEQARCLEILEELFDPGGLLVVSGSLPPDVDPAFYRRAADLADERDVRVIGDTSGPGLRALAESGVFMLKPNRRELSELIGRELAGDDAPADGARELIESGKAGMVCVSMGEAGAWLVSSDSRLFAAPPAIELKSRIGAGDSMVAAMTLAVWREAADREMLARAVAAGSAAVLTAGTALARREDYEELTPRITVEDRT